MKTTQKTPAFELDGKWQYRMQNLGQLYWSTLYVAMRRVRRGPLLPDWSWSLETSMHFSKAQSLACLRLPTVSDARAYEDAFTFGSPALAQVHTEPVNTPIKGHWYQPQAGASDVTVLYLHGGGFVYYAKAHRNLIALVALAAGAKTFAPDYRLAPEHPFPAQLDDALAAYRRLLDSGVSPQRLVLAGDSAGGNLALALLLALRDERLPFPAVTIGLAPWTDLANSGDSMIANEPYDLIDRHMAAQWAEWYCQNTDHRTPRVSPLYADLHGLPPIYLQAGSAEILHDMIRAFADRAQAQGVDIRLEVWKNMTHDFQAFGNTLPQSQAALARIGKVVKQYVG